MTHLGIPARLVRYKPQKRFQHPFRIPLFLAVIKHTLHGSRAEAGLQTRVPRF